MAKNVIFDLGGVVVEWNPQRILQGYYSDPQLRRLLQTALFEHPDWLDLDRGTVHEPELLTRVRQRTGRPEEEIAGLLQAARESLEAKPATVELLERLSARGVPLYCLSNISRANFGYLRRRHSFWGVFRGVVISGDLQLMKPEPEIFEHLLQRYGLAASETVFIDDVEPNVLAARALGLHTVWFKDALQCERELDELLV